MENLTAEQILEGNRKDLSYPIHILNIQKWHYMEVADKWNKEIEKHAPEEHSCRFYNEAMVRVRQFQEAIDRLSTPPIKTENSTT